MQNSRFLWYSLTYIVHNQFVANPGKFECNTRFNKFQLNNINFPNQNENHKSQIRDKMLPLLLSPFARVWRELKLPPFAGSLYKCSQLRRYTRLGPHINAKGETVVAIARCFFDTTVVVNLGQRATISTSMYYLGLLSYKYPMMLLVTSNRLLFLSSCLISPLRHSLWSEKWSWQHDHCARLASGAFCTNVTNCCEIEHFAICE